MSPSSVHQPTFAPITAAMIERMHQLAPAAVARMRAFGLADRRESAWVLLLAPMVPMLGWLHLGWTTDTVLAGLLANVGICLLEDLARILSAAGSFGDRRHENIADAFVWPIATAQMRGRRKVYAGNLSTADQWEPSHPRREPILFNAAFGCFSIGLPLLILSTLPTSTANPSWIAAGTVPSLGLLAASHGAQWVAGARTWRQTGSVRIGTLAGNAMIAFLLGSVSLVLLVFERIDNAVVFAGVVILAWGIWRLRRVANLREAMTWLARQPAASVDPARGRP